MRQDMSKVIVERPRRGGSSKYNKRGRRKEILRNSIATEVNHYFNPPEQKYEDIFYCCAECTGEPWLLPLGAHEFEVPSNLEGMRPRGRGTDRKEFNENLMPLWRYLRSQVGRHWDDVYSDIREPLSTKNTIHMHVVQHLKWQVIENTYLEDNGSIYAERSYGRTECMDAPTNYKFQFYVHPVTGELCESPLKGKKLKKGTPTKLQPSTMTQFRFMDGGWYVITLEQIPKKLGTPKAYGISDRLFGGWTPFPLNYEKVGDILFPDGLSTWKREQEYGYANLYAVSKREIGKRELKVLRHMLKTET